MQILIRDLAPGQDYAIQFRSNDGEGNVSDWSQVQRFTTTNDTLAPGNVANLAWYDAGTSFMASWDKVILNTDNSPCLDLKDYHVNVSNGQTSVDFYTTDTKFEFTDAANIQQWGTLQNSLTVSVTARDRNYNESPLPAVKHFDPLMPPTPSTPVIGGYIGLLLVSWDGKDNAGHAMPSNVGYAEVHVSTDTGFTPTTATFVGRVFHEANTSSFSVPGLVAGKTYYIKLVAVNLMNKRSGASAQASGAPGRISGLDIQDGQISPSQINFSARDIGGANAYYSTSQPVTTDVPGGFKTGDIWYDIDDHYTTYRYDSTVIPHWVPAPEVGVIAGTKILAGTLTADAVGTNLLITSQANIGQAVIDAANISTVNASSIRSGTIYANQGITAGNPDSIHTEMRDTGFYVYAPGKAVEDPNVPIAMNPAVKMGTGDGDTFTITDPNHPDLTLASISQGGVASFQDLFVQQSPVIMGRDFATDWMKGAGGKIVGEAWIAPITGLNNSGASGIRTEYGIGSFSFPVEQGKTYQVTSRLKHYFCYGSAAAEPNVIIRLQKDSRTAAQIAAGSAPTAVTIQSQEYYRQYFVEHWNTNYHSPEVMFFYRADFTGVVSFGYSLALGNIGAADCVIKIPDNSTLEFQAVDVGYSMPQQSNATNMGGSLYVYQVPPPPPPPPPPVRQNYSWSGHFNWVRSYKSNNAWMTNTNGLGYQGLDPSGYNGNQKSLMGFSQVDFAAMLSGATNISISLYLYYAHWYYNSGGTAVIGYSSVWGDPGTGGWPGGNQNLIQRGGVPKPGSFTIDISGWAGAFQNGSFRSIVLGAGPSTSETYYGYASDCAITVNYTK
jgi:hypothetical protein